MAQPRQSSVVGAAVGTVVVGANDGAGDGAAVGAGTGAFDWTGATTFGQTMPSFLPVAAVGAF